jgi:hypothetical protein
MTVLKRNKRHVPQSGIFPLAFLGSILRLKNKASIFPNLLDKLCELLFARNFKFFIINIRVGNEGVMLALALPPFSLAQALLSFLMLYSFSNRFRN